MNTPEKDNITSFIKAHRPKAPEAPPNELNLIRDKIAASSIRRRFVISWWRFAVPIAVAASLTFFVVTDFLQQEQTQLTPENKVALEEFMEETYAVLDNGNEELQVGSDWLLLVP